MSWTTTFLERGLGSNSANTTRWHSPRTSSPLPRYWILPESLSSDLGRPVTDSHTICCVHEGYILRTPTRRTREAVLHWSKKLGPAAESPKQEQEPEHFL